MIAYTCGHAQDARLFATNADINRHLAEHPEHDIGPRWFPDGTPNPKHKHHEPTSDELACRSSDLYGTKEQERELSERFASYFDCIEEIEREDNCPLCSADGGKTYLQCSQCRQQCRHLLATHQYIDSKGVKVDSGAVSPVSPPSYKFPVEALPSPLRRLVESGANSIGCDESMVAVPGLSALAAAIGSTRTARVKESWDAPAILWGVVISESSTGKSPAFMLAIAPFVKIQNEYFSDPEPKRIRMEDATLDSVAPVLKDNPRGVLLACEELHGWFQGFTRYSAGGASDQPRWLKLYGGESLIVDRKTSGSINVPRANASITGGIQPGVFARSLTKESLESGLIARLLLAMPPRKSLRWTDKGVPQSVKDEYEACIRNLLALEFDEDKKGTKSPRSLPLSRDAAAIYIDYYNETVEKFDSIEIEERAALGKLTEIAVRLALVYELADADQPDSVEEISLHAMGSAIYLARWFSDEVMRAYSPLLLRADTKVIDASELLTWIKKIGKKVTFRDVINGAPRKYRTKQIAQDSLDCLVESRVLEREVEVVNKRPFTKYFIPPGDTGYTAPKRNLST